jgi:hypothetical protein
LITRAKLGIKMPRVTVPRESETLVARRSRVAGAALAIVLLAVTIFAVVSSLATSAAAGRAAAASRLSDVYARAAAAVGAEESLVSRVGSCLVV